jgi:hypothetical protein
MTPHFVVARHDSAEAISGTGVRLPRPDCVGICDDRIGRTCNKKEFPPVTMAAFFSQDPSKPRYLKIFTAVEAVVSAGSG